MNGDAAKLIGTSVGEYDLTALLDEQGRGVVYRAEHRKLHSACACKVIHPAYAADRAAVEEFIATARAKSQAHHPNTVDIFDVGTLSDGRPYFVMELLAGRTLASQLAAGPLGLVEIGHLAVGLCGALSAAHGAGLVAQDLDPRHLFVEERKNQPPQLKLVYLRIGTPDMPAAIAAVGALLQKLCASVRPLPPELSRIIEQSSAATSAPWGSLAEFAAAIKHATQSKVAVSGWRRPLMIGMAVSLMLGIPAVGAGIYRLATSRSTESMSSALPSFLSLYRLAIKELQTGLRSADPMVRKQALQALEQAPDVHFRDRVEPLLDDGDGAVQVQAARTLGRLGARGAVAPLLAHAQAAGSSPRDLAFKVACGEALMRLGEDNGKRLLSEALRGNTPAGSQLTAALSLESHGDAAARTFLDQELAKKSADAETTLRILGDRAQRFDEGALQTLTDRLSSTGTATAEQVRAAAFLAPMNHGAARETLRAAASSKGPLQLRAAHALCMADDASNQKLLTATLQDSKRAIEDRELAATGLGVCGDRGAVRVLADVLRQPDAPALLKQSVAGALLRLSSIDPQVVAERNVSLARLALTDDNWTVRESAATLLGEVLKPIGKVAGEAREKTASLPEAVQLLRQAMGDSRGEVRLAALRASGELGSRLMAMGSEIDNKEALEQLRQVLSQRASQGDASERVVADAMLARVGAGTPLEKLERGLKAQDAALRRLAVKEAAGNVEIPVSAFVALLDDKDQEVRFTAACALAARGQRQGLKVLLAALRAGGAHRERAVRMLAILDEPIPSDMALTPERIGEMLGSPAALTRLEAVEALPRLAMKVAIELLLKAVRDVDSAVRWRVAEVAAELARRPQGSLALGALRTLAGDDDVAVRAHASALLSTVAGSVSEPTPTPPPTPVAKEPADKPHAEKAAVDGEVATTSKPSKGTPGTPATPDKAAPSQVESLYARGADLLGRKDYRGAFKQLERANQLCARLGEERAVCDRLGSDLAYHLGQAYESQGAWSNAMAEYQTVQKRGRAAQQTAAREAISRLGARLGKVVMFQRVKGKCRPVDVWMEPGNHLLKLGDGSRKPVELKAGDVIEIKSCQ